MVAKHYSGSGLEYKPIKVTDWLTPLSEEYKRDKDILAQQHRYLRERDQQMVEKAANEEALAKALLNLGVGLAKKDIDKNKKEKLEQEKNRLAEIYNTPEKRKAWADIYNAGKNKLNKESDEYNQLVANFTDTGLDIALTDKAYNMSPDEAIVYQEYFGIRKAKSLTRDNFNEYKAKQQAKVDSGIGEIDQIAVDNLRFEDWVWEEMADFKPSNGLFTTKQRQEIERILDANRNKSTATANKLIFNNEKRTIVDRIAEFGEANDEGKSLSEYFDRLYSKLTPQKRFEATDSQTSTQRVSDYLGEVMYEAGYADIISDTVLNKYCTSETFIGNDGKSRTILEQFGDRDGKLYQMICKGRNAGRAQRTEFEKAQFNAAMEIEVFNQPIGDDFDLNNANLILKKLQSSTYTDPKLVTRQERIIANNTNRAETNNKYLEAVSADKNGGLFKHSEHLEKLRGSSKEINDLADKAKAQKELLEENNYTEAGIDTQTQGKRLGQPWDSSKGTTTLTETVIAQRKAFKRADLNRRLEPYWDATKKEYVFPNAETKAKIFTDNAEAVKLDWEVNDGGVPGGQGKYALNTGDNADYLNAGRYTDLQTEVKNQFEVKYTDEGAINTWEQRLVTKGKRKLDGVDIVGILQNGRLSDEAMYKALRNDETPLEFFKRELNELLKSEDAQDIALVKLHKLDKDSAINKLEDFAGLSAYTQVIDSLPPGSTLLYKMNRVGLNGLDPKDYRLLMGQLKDSADKTRQTEIKTAYEADLQKRIDEKSNENKSSTNPDEPLDEKLGKVDIDLDSFKSILSKLEKLGI